MRDSKEFRERFKRWKDGKLVYENGRALPVFEDGNEPSIVDKAKEFAKDYASFWWKTVPLTIGKIASQPTMVLASPGVATSYATTGRHMPRVLSTVGDEAAYLLDAVTAPTQPADIKAAYLVVRHPIRTIKTVKDIAKKATDFVGSVYDGLPWTYNIPKNSNMAYRRMGPLERDWIMGGNELSTRSTNPLTELEEAEARASSKKIGRFSLYKAGADHGGRKQFAKGQPWKGTTVTHGEELILAIPGKNLPWVSGRHFSGPLGHGFRVGDVSFDEAPFGSHIDLLTKGGYSGVNPSLLEGSVIYSPFKIFGRNFGYKKLYPNHIIPQTRAVNASNDFSDTGALRKFLSLMAKQTLSRSAESQALTLGSPEFIIGVDKLFPEDISKVIYNTTLHRMERMRPSYRKGILFPTVKSRVQAAVDKGYTEYPKWLFEQYGNGTTIGIHFTKDGHIAIKNGELTFAGPHEIRHRIDNRLLPLTEDEDVILSKAYDSNFLNLPEFEPRLKGTDMRPERVTTNLDARTNLLRDLGMLDASVDLQNELLDMLGPSYIFNAVDNANGYGRAYIDYLRANNLLTEQKANALRDAMKYVGAYGLPMGIGAGSLYGASNYKTFTEYRQ